jgi:photosystem II stability/assembly factor-like uncharacterized protein
MSTSAFLNRSVTLIAILTMAVGSVGLTAPPPHDSARSGSARRVIDLRISEFQPAVPQGGRANTIAVHPKKDDTILVASESGGLFKSTDGGVTWNHIDTLGPYFTNSVAFLPKYPNVAIVTTSEDFSMDNQGGVWRSEDEGNTWSPVSWSTGGLGGPNTKPKLSPSPSGITGRFSAFEISIAPDTGRIFVASSAGVEVSSGDGTTWIHRNPGSAALPVLTVLALDEEKAGQGNTVLAGGPAGVWRSTDGGVSWAQLADGPGCASQTPRQWPPAGCVMDMHAFGRSPAAKTQAFVMNNDKELYYTSDGGVTWEMIWQTPNFDTGCGGIAFVQSRLSPAVPGAPAPNLLLYFGDRCLIYRLTAPPIAGTGINDYKANKPELLTADHYDTRHIAFNNSNVPLLLATDGGLHKTGDGGNNWLYTGGGAGGYNALQIYQVKGQLINDTGKQNLYFGTQDNGFFSSDDIGKTWVKWGNEGDFFEAMPVVATKDDSQITLWANSKNWRMKGLSLADALTPWPDPPEQAPGQENAASVGRPKIVGKNFHVQWVEDNYYIDFSSGKPVPTVLRRKGLAVTYSLGEPTTSDPDGWQQYAVISDKSQCGNCSRRDLPRVVYPANREPILYQALARNGGIDGSNFLERSVLARLMPNPNGDDATPDYPAMTNFGGFGIAPTMQGWPRVFAVDPVDPNYLLAPDVFGQEMMESRDGGGIWTRMQQLTSLVTDRGKLNFRGRIFFSQFPGSVGFEPITQVSAIKFNPLNPDLVAIGTVQNGVFLSIDRGKSWEKVPGSERATLISSLYWRTFDEIVVSTYGRGLWRVNFKIVTGKRCTECIHILYEKPPRQRPSPEDLTILAYGGEIRGVSLRDGKLREVFVRPGTSLAYVEDLLGAPNILLTETMTSLTSLGAAPLPGAPAGAPVISGLTVRKVGNETELVEVLFAPRPLSMFTPPSAGPAIVSPYLPAPSWSGPTFEVLSGPEVLAGDPIQMKGGGLPAGTEVEIQFDKITAQKVVADQNGNFAVTVTAPPLWGFHILAMEVGGTVVNGAIVSIRPGK